MTAIWSFPNIQKETKKKLMTGLFKLYDVNQKGELFAVDETNKIYQFNILDKIDMWPYDEDKLAIKCFGDNYLAASIRVKRDEEFIGYRAVLYDLKNLYFGYNPNTETFPAVLEIISNDQCLYVMIINNK